MTVHAAMPAPPLELISLRNLRDGAVDVRAPSEDDVIQLNGRYGIPKTVLTVAKEGDRVGIKRQDGIELQIAMTWPHGAPPGQGRRDMAFLGFVSELTLYRTEGHFWVPEGPVVLDSYRLLKFCKLAAAHAVFNQYFNRGNNG